MIKPAREKFGDQLGALFLDTPDALDIDDDIDVDLLIAMNNFLKRERSKRKEQ